MSHRRVKLTESQYNELTESRDWCAKHGLTGLREFYDQELDFQAGRRALPDGAREYQRQDEERPRRR
jgi:hypothetical protein